MKEFQNRKTHNNPGLTGRAIGIVLGSALCVGTIIKDECNSEERVSAVSNDVNAKIGETSDTGKDMVEADVVEAENGMEEK